MLGVIDRQLRVEAVGLVECLGCAGVVLQPDEVRAAIEPGEELLAPGEDRCLGEGQVSQQQVG